MPFREGDEGQTHSFNDGCGNLLHNEMIVCAAIHWPLLPSRHELCHGVEGTVVTGKRHKDCLSLGFCMPIHFSLKEGEVQGFLTSHRRFVTREEAARIAYIAGQIKEKKETLFSEDLY